MASLTGYSRTTVSIVVNGRAAQYGVSARTRDLILAAAREHHYAPDPHARRLRNRDSEIVGLMLPTLSNRFFAELAETFDALARGGGSSPSSP